MISRMYSSISRGVIVLSHIVVEHQAMVQVMTKATAETVVLVVRSVYAREKTIIPVRKETILLTRASVSKAKESFQTTHLRPHEQGVRHAVQDCKRLQMKKARPHPVHVDRLARSKIMIELKTRNQGIYLPLH
jgi:hypothetical protein